MALKLNKSTAANAVSGFAPYWYGAYRAKGGVKTVALGVPLRGKPPATGDLSEQGDADFERSRAKAQAKLDALIKKAKDEDDGIREARHLVEATTGRKFRDPELSELAEMNLKGRTVSPAHAAMIRSCFSKFAAFAARPSDGLKPARTLLGVTNELAVAFFKTISTDLAFSTVERFANLLAGTFTALAPAGTKNPFHGARVAAVGRAGTKLTEDGTRIKTETVVHHRPLDRAEIEKLFGAAEDDPLLYPLVVTCAATGLRVGDACLLKWASVDLKKSVAIVTTQKTGATCAVPIFDYDTNSPNFEPLLGEFRRVLETALAEAEDGEKFVFPQAARLYLTTTKNADGRTVYAGRDKVYAAGKALFARALFADEAEDAELIDADKTIEEKTPDEALALIAATDWEDGRKTRVATIFSLHADGKTYREIQAETGFARSTISTDLAAVERLTGTKIRKGDGLSKTSLRSLLDKTRMTREAGARRASVLSFHSLRGSFVSLALGAGVPIELVRQIVGHAEVEMTLSYYNPTAIQAAETARQILARRNERKPAIEARETFSPALSLSNAPNAAGGGFDALRAVLANLSADERKALAVELLK